MTSSNQLFKHKYLEPKFDIEKISIPTFKFYKGLQLTHKIAFEFFTSYALYGGRVELLLYHLTNRKEKLSNDKVSKL